MNKFELATKLVVEDVKSDYWIDIIRRMSLAMVKIALG